ncbi:MAG TPA: hypothetical protein VGK78_17175 [Nocardioides sp.]|uniref:hypothetical protein n=1 Tax=Nocardioides sp. TaxID=35761 RepID=UPI002F42ED3B
MTTLNTASVTGVVCPAWCSVTQSTHLRELRWEGRAMHWSDPRSGEGWEIRHTSATDADGLAVDTEPQVYVTTDGGLTLAGAEALALTLLAAYEEATG